MHFIKKHGRVNRILAFVLIAVMFSSMITTAKAEKVIKIDRTTQEETQSGDIDAEPTGEPADSSDLEAEPTGEPADSPGLEAEPTGEPTDSPGLETEPTGEPTEEPGLDVEPTGEPTDDSDIEVEPIYTEDMAFDKVISKEDFEKAEGTINSTLGAVVIDMTDDIVIGAVNALEEYNSIDVSELMTLYTMVKLCPKLSSAVTVTKDMLTPVKDSRYLFGFEAGDKATYRNFILCYMFTRTDDTRSILVNALAGSEENFVEKMKGYAEELGLESSDFVASDGAYEELQFTSIYDVYVIVNALEEHLVFRSYYKDNTVTITYKREGKSIDVDVADFSESKYGAIPLPKGYTCIWQFTGGSNKYGFNGVTIVSDKEGRFYFAAMMCPDFTKEINEELSRLIGIVKGEVFEDKVYGLVLPTGSNEERHQYLLGVSEDIFTSDNRPAGYETAEQADEYMMTITVPVWVMRSDGTKYSSTYDLVVHRKLANNIKAIYDDIYALDIQFPIKIMKAYGYRMVGGVGLSNSTLMSMHAFGAAIDINYGDYDNDYFLGAGNDLRNKDNPYCIPDEVIEIFAKHGWNWGGDFSICVDSMHFQYLGLEYLTYQNNSPFKDYRLDMKGVRGVNVQNLQERLAELGFSVRVDGVYSYATANAIRKFQAKYSLPVTGEVDYKTWETIINLTHYMAYTF